MILTVMEHEGRKIVRELISYDVTVWRIAKETGVSYATAKAWKKGWWNPDGINTSKLWTLRAKIKREQNRD